MRLRAHLFGSVLRASHLTHALEAVQTKPERVKFINELGNSISLRVLELPITGSNSKTHEEFKDLDGVMIELQGPHSISENHITRMEAEKLYEQLGRVLGK